MFKLTRHDKAQLTEALILLIAMLNLFAAIFTFVVIY